MSTTILKGLKVLEYLAHAEGPRGISEVARAIDMNKSAVQRILTTLLKRDYVEHAPGTSKYRLTLSVWELGSHVVDRHEARRLIHPILRYGAQETGFTAFLTFRSFPFVVYLDKVEGPRGRAHSAEPGTRIPIDRTASGKAVLAWLSPEEAARIGQDQTDWTGQVPFHSAPIAAMAGELDDIRTQGFATSRGGVKPGANSLAAPVWWRETAPYGSIALSADKSALPEARFGEIGRKVMEMAEEATRALGGANLQRAAEAAFADGSADQKKIYNIA